ncbi:hypothetical protein ACWGKW_26900 [Streptomyces sp. NPDC054766]
MTTEEPRSGLPIEFLHAIAAEAGLDSPPIRMAVEKTRNLPEGTRRDDLLLALLRGALSDSAPEWLLQAAIDSGFRKENRPYESPSMSLAAAALAHPACPDPLRKEALRRCSLPQLGTLGSQRCGEELAEAIVMEFDDRGPHQQPMTPELLETPSTAQLILGKPQLHDTVFSAALERLPKCPQLSGDESGDDDILDRYDRYLASRKAWEGMWEHIVTTHTTRHRQLVDWAPDNNTRQAIRDHLLGTLPWEVESSLLEELAHEDLSGFTISDLITRGSRMLKDGFSKEETRSQLGDAFNALEPKVRKRVERFFDDSDDVREIGLRTAVTWVASRAEGSWRHVLNPAEAKNRYGEPHSWHASGELLAALGQRFAAVAVAALYLWEPDSCSARPSPQDLRWLHSLLLHLPGVTDEVKQKARTVVQHVRPRPRNRWDHLDHKTQQEDQRLAELRAVIERILGDPATVSLGDPKQVTHHELARASDKVLDDYLPQHSGNDDLAERVLLSYASNAHRSKLSFSTVLAHHSAPDAALLQITTDLRKRLGGGPHLRETWTRQVLTLPDCTPELIRALPAWTALTVGGPRYGTAHKAVASVVLAALGDSDEAWTRFATSPASYAGPTAWLRLGDILDASAHGTAWPQPPRAR